MHVCVCLISKNVDGKHTAWECDTVVVKENIASEISLHHKYVLEEQ